MPNQVGVQVDIEKGTMCCISACGECFDLPAEAFEALSRCLSRSRKTAEITMTFRNGGLTGCDFRERIKPA